VSVTSPTVSNEGKFPDQIDNGEVAVGMDLVIMLRQGKVADD
jgi:hypothetical protein